MPTISLTKATPTQIAKILSIVNMIFLGDENHSPLFMCSQNMPVNPKVNQLPNRAVCFQVSWVSHLFIDRSYATSTYDQAKKIVENRNCFGDDPGDDPKNEGNGNPGASGDPISLMHPVCASKDTDVE